MATDLLAVSPHCDDAVFGAGDVLVAHPGATVVTVFAGAPAPGAALTAWDAAAGFAPGDDVMALRRAEDREALGLVGAAPVWLDFRDAQYGAPPDAGDVAAELARVLARVRPRQVLLPLGLFHADHALAHAATVELATASVWLDVLWYEDAIYRRLPGLVAERVRALRARGLALRCLGPAAPGPASPCKRAAVRCYRSQLRALATPGRPGVADAFAEEALWRLER